MSVSEQLIAGLQLTVTGMLTVFVLLSFMVFAIGWMSKLAHRLAPPGRPVPTSSGEATDPSKDTELIAVIGAAVHRFRNSRR